MEQRVIDPEVGDALAEFENRISALEVAQPYADVIPELRQRLDTLESNLNREQPEWTRNQWDEVQQMKGQMLHLQKEIEELHNLDKKRNTKDLL